MTDAEIKAEVEYRFQERLGILAGSNPPTQAQIHLAQTEAREWERLWRKSTELFE